MMTVLGFAGSFLSLSLSIYFPVETQSNSNTLKIISSEQREEKIISKKLSSYKFHSQTLVTFSNKSLWTEHLNQLELLRWQALQSAAQLKSDYS